MSHHRRNPGPILLLVMAMAFVVPACPQQLGAQDSGREAAASPAALTDEIIVKFKNNSPAAAAATLHRTLGVAPTARSERARFDVVRVPPGSSPDALIEEYLSSGLVEYAEPNYPVSIAWEPDDELYTRQWNFEQVNAAAGWEIAGGGTEDIIVAVIDTGVAYEDRDRYLQAPDLADTSFIHGWDFINDDAYANDDHGHGTHVAGTIAQSTDNGVGAAGLAFDVTIMPVKVLNYLGSGSLAGVSQGIYYAVDNGAHVINMSLSSSFLGATLQEALDYAAAHGVVVVAAAGNSGATTNVPQYPAAYDTVIAVGATRFDRTRAYYSNYGDYVAIAAPGGDMSVDQDGDGFNDGVLQQTFSGTGRIDSFSYRYLQGTSMASPHVAAAAALLLSLNPSLTSDEVRSILESTAADLGADGKDPHFGHGLLDVAAAVDLAAPSVVASPRRFEFSLLSGLSESGSLHLSNRSEEPVSYSITAYDRTDGMAQAEATWLDVSPALGVLPPGGSSDHVLTVDAAGLAAGEYEAEIVVQTGNPDDYPFRVLVSLLVTPGLPVVTTGPITDIAETSASGDGAISYLGMDTCDAVGLCWSTAPLPLASGNKVELAGSFGEEAFGPFMLDELAAGTIYYARAYAHNSAGYGYGGQVSFTTLPSPPSELQASDPGAYQVTLAWAPGDGAQWTHIRVKQGSYPTDREDGDAVYDGPDSSYVCGPLDPGATHYFRAWSRTLDANGGPVWSDGATDATATTAEGAALASVSIELHSGWNMVSVPLDLLSFDDLTRVFPGAVAAYIWNGTTYEPVTRIEPGAGYWVAVPTSASGSLVIRGLPSEVQSCELFAGWNLVGSLSAVESSSLADLNVVGASGTETLDLDHVYWWDGTSYVTPADIEPGMACWLASSAPCTLAIGEP